MKEKENYHLRPYRPEDCRETARLFYQTVHQVNARDYSPGQLDAWAPEDRDLQAWDQLFRDHFSLVAERDGQIVGFGDMDVSQAYLDRLYVRWDLQGQGIGAALCSALEEQAGGRSICVHASITAKPFFEKRGYRVLKEQQVQRKGISLTNYVMEKTGED